MCVCLPLRTLTESWAISIVIYFFFCPPGRRASADHITECSVATQRALFMFVLKSPRTDLSPPPFVHPSLFFYLCSVYTRCSFILYLFFYIFTSSLSLPTNQYMTRSIRCRTCVTAAFKDFGGAVSFHFQNHVDVRILFFFGRLLFIVEWSRSHRWAFGWGNIFGFTMASRKLAGTHPLFFFLSDFNPFSGSARNPLASIR